MRLGGILLVASVVLLTGCKSERNLVSENPTKFITPSDAVANAPDPLLGEKSTGPKPSYTLPLNANGPGGVGLPGGPGGGSMAPGGRPGVR